MKKVILFLCLILGNISVFAFEDKVYVYEESNVLFQIMTGNERSKEKFILESYLKLINNCVKDIDSTQNIYIQYDQQDYYSDHSFYTLSYGNFSDFALYGKIPFENSERISEKFDKKGIVIYFSNNFLKLKPILQLIEYGLKNKNEVIKNQYFINNKIDTIQVLEDRSFYLDIMYKNRVSNNLNRLNYVRINNDLINSIINNPKTQIQIDYLEIKTTCSNLYKELSENNYKLYLQNDSCYIENYHGDIIRLENIYGIRYVKEKNSLFIFDSQESFIFTYLNNKSYKKSYKLPFKIDCFQGICFSVLQINFDYNINKYKIQLVNWIGSEDSNENYPYCFYDPYTNIIHCP